MGTRQRPLIGSILFFGLAPGIVAGWLPYVLSGWRLEEPFFGLSALRIPGGILVLVGLACLVDCFARFALQGEGTLVLVYEEPTLRRQFGDSF